MGTKRKLMAWAAARQRAGQTIHVKRLGTQTTEAATAPKTRAPESNSSRIKRYACRP